MAKRYLELESDIGKIHNKLNQVELCLHNCRDFIESCVGVDKSELLHSIKIAIGNVQLNNLLRDDYGDKS